MRTITVKLPEELDRKLGELARRRKASQSTIIREAIEALTSQQRLSVTSAAGGLVGSLHGPADLSTSSEHFSGYGE